MKLNREWGLDRRKEASPMKLQDRQTAELSMCAEETIVGWGGKDSVHPRYNEALCPLSPGVPSGPRVSLFFHPFPGKVCFKKKKNSPKLETMEAFSF